MECPPQVQVMLTERLNALEGGRCRLLGTWFGTYKVIFGLSCLLTSPSHHQEMNTLILFCHAPGPGSMGWNLCSKSQPTQLHNNLKSSWQQQPMGNTAEIKESVHNSLSKWWMSSFAPTERRPATAGERGVYFEPGLHPAQHLHRINSPTFPVINNS